MTLKDHLLSATRDDPKAVRELFASPQVFNGLSKIGVLVKVLELHAPSLRSKKAGGLGATLCGIRGTRHAVVTCRRCAEKIRASEKGNALHAGAS